MSNLLILQPLPIAAAISDAPSSANVLTPDPKEVWYEGAPGIYSLHIDMGSPVELDTFYLGFLSPGSYIFAVETQTALNTNVSEPLAGNNAPLVQKGKRLHSLVRLSAPVTSRWWRMRVVSSGPLWAGALAVGKAFQPQWNKEWGSGRQPLDTGAREPVIGGGFGIGKGVRKHGYSWTFGDLSDEEVERLDDIALECGETSPIVVIEDPDASPHLNKRIHYGLFNRFEAFERQNPAQTRWSMSMTEWV